MVKVDIVAGFLGAGKTTLINKLLEGAVEAHDTVLIENEFGEVSIDDSLLADSGMGMRTLSSGCICCTLRGNFVAAIPEIVETYHPKRIIIEPTGMACPKDLLAICEDAAHGAPIEVNSLISVVNAANLDRIARMNIPVFNQQFDSMRFAVFSHVDGMGPDEVERKVSVLRDKVGYDVPVVTQPWETVDALELLSLAEQAFSDYAARNGDVAQEGEGGHDHDHDHGCDCGHEHRHHHHGPNDMESLAFEPAEAFSAEQIDELLALLSGEEAGTVFRAKGFLEQEGQGMKLVELVYGSTSVDDTSYAGTAKFVVIGQKLDEGRLRAALNC